MQTLSGLAKLEIDKIFNEIHEDREKVVDAIIAVTRVQVLKSLRGDGSSPSKKIVKTQKVTPKFDWSTLCEGEDGDLFTAIKQQGININLGGLTKEDAEWVLENLGGDYEEAHQKAEADLANHPVPDILNEAAKISKDY